MGLSIMANVDEFVSVQGGNSVLSSMLCAGEQIIYFQKGSEYNAGDFSFYPKLAANQLCNVKVFNERQNIIDYVQNNRNNLTAKPCTGCTIKNCQCQYIY